MLPQDGHAHCAGALSLLAQADVAVPGRHAAKPVLA
jgi:hypothetical protein